jgi:hypothetical protein
VAIFCQLIFIKAFLKKCSWAECPALGVPRSWARQKYGSNAVVRFGAAHKATRARDFTGSSSATPVKYTGFAFRGALIEIGSNQKNPVATTQSPLGNSPAHKKQLEVVMQICR